MAGKNVEVTQVRSANRRNRKNLETLEGLGLGKIGRKRVHVLTPSTEGMIRAVAHLVTVRDAAGEGSKK